MIPKIQHFFKDKPVTRAWLFGSCSRGEEATDSDIDILVNYDRTKRISLMTITRLICSLEDILQRRVDLVEEDGLIACARDNVNHDKILIYERKS